MIVALVGCDRGMTCAAGAEGVGKATTQSVVYFHSYAFCC